MPPIRNFTLARTSSALAIFAALLGSTAPSPLYPIYLRELGLSHAMGTAIFAIYAVGTLFALVISARLGTVVPDQRRFIVPGLVVTAAGALIFANADSLTLLLLGRFLNGFGTGAVTGMASAALYELAPPHKRRHAATIATLAFTGGAAGGPLVSSAAIALHLAPTVTPFILIATICALATAGLLFCDWPTTNVPRSKKMEESKPAAEDATVMPLFIIACLAVCTAWMLGSLIMAVGSDLGTNLYGMKSAGMAGMIAAIFQSFAGAGQALCGRAKPLNSIVGGFAGLMAAQLLLVLMSGGNHAILLLAMMAACGLAYGAAFVGALGLASASAAGHRRARMISYFYIIGYLSNALPTLAMGVLIDNVGLQPAFEMFSVVVIAIACIGIVSAIKARSYRL